MEKEFNASDLIVNKNLVPSNYIEVKLSSIGRLGLPEIIHVRDYTYDEASIFAQATNETQEEAILQVLKNIIWEDVDLTKITAQDAIEICMSIQGTWYTPTIEKKYIVDESLNGDERYNKENISSVEIPINIIQTKTLDEKIKLPINITYRDESVSISYPTIFNIITAKKYINNKYAEKENRINELKLKVKNENYTESDLLEIANYETKKESEYDRVLNSLILLSHNGIPLEDIEDKIKVFSLLPIGFINIIKEVIENIQFGVVSELSFKDVISHQQITRRFDFRLTDFLSSLGQPNKESYSVSFG